MNARFYDISNLTRVDIESTPTEKECIRSVGEGFSLPIFIQMLLYDKLGASRTSPPTDEEYNRFRRGGFYIRPLIFISLYTSSVSLRLPPSPTGEGLGSGGCDVCFANLLRSASEVESTPTTYYLYSCRGGYQPLVSLRKNAKKYTAI